MNYAKTAANWYAEIGGDPAHASVYDDGAIIYVCVTEDTQSQIVAELGDNVKECARSDNEFCGVIIGKPDEWMHCLDVVAGFIEIKWTDCRWADANTIELFVGGQLQRSKK